MMAVSTHALYGKAAARDSKGIQPRDGPNYAGIAMMISKIHRKPAPVRCVSSIDQGGQKRRTGIQEPSGAIISNLGKWGNHDASISASLDRGGHPLIDRSIRMGI
ncbi:MAG: hypothetical protein WCA26_04660 [Xanthobacteraceae bacterium]|jgi:hypothetical protein